MENLLDIDDIREGIQASIARSRVMGNDEYADGCIEATQSFVTLMREAGLDPKVAGAALMHASTLLAWLVQIGAGNPQTPTNIVNVLGLGGLYIYDEAEVS